MSKHTLLIGDSLQPPDALMQTWQQELRISLTLHVTTATAAWAHHGPHCLHIWDGQGQWQQQQLLLQRLSCATGTMRASHTGCPHVTRCSAAAVLVHSSVGCSVYSDNWHPTPVLW
jgi:hypothetical protein